MSDKDEDSHSATTGLRAVAHEFGPATVRPGENPLTHWFLLSGNRLTATGALLLAMFVGLIALMVIRSFDTRRLVA